MKSISIKDKLVPFFFAILRIAIGWQFLYEGLVKIVNPAWTARAYLENSRWIFGDLFRWMISTDAGMWIIDSVNRYGLTLIGLALILGVFTRIASWGGITLLLSYYVAYPPFGGFSYGAPSEGSYMIVNKNLIEMFGLVLLAFVDSGHFFGLDMLLKKKSLSLLRKSEPDEENVDQKKNTRRELLKSFAGIPALALFSGAFVKNLFEIGPELDSVSGATISVDFKQIKDLKAGICPKGKLGDLTVSRMIMGCNLIIGESHGRDLIYTDKLFKAYNTENKIFQTINLAEKAGMNTMVMTIGAYSYLNKYNDIYKSKIQGICMAELPEKDLLSQINQARDCGPTSIYIHGRAADAYIMEEKIDEIFKAIEHIKKQGYQAGLGAHCIETIERCEKEGIPVDYYLKTFHHDQYWSALPEEYRDDPYMVIGPKYLDHNRSHDNMWDLYPQYSVEVMKEVHKPFIAFKVLAAGAIEPKDGFRYAFENGADFINVGMFDWQVIDNVNTVNEVLGDLKKRERKWFS